MGEETRHACGRSEPISGTNNWGTATYNEGTSGQGLWYFADVNGDGLKDALYVTGPFDNQSWSMRINTGEGFLAPVALDTSRCMPALGRPQGHRRQSVDRRPER